MGAHVYAAPAARPRKPFYQHLYVQVIAAIVIGRPFPAHRGRGHAAAW